MRILLLEDSSTDAELTRISLTNSIPGCIICTASTLKDARSLLNTAEGFDIALLDMSLPDGKGQELLAEIRLSGADMAIVMLTGSGNEEVAVAALKAGADDYVIKRKDYISQLPVTIHFAIDTYQHNKQLRTDLLKLLYIEHNSSDLDLTVRHLKQYSPNIAVESVLTAEEALLILPADETPGKHQVILMDYRLPGLNALEFIKIMRQDRKSDIPIILVSGQGNEDIAVQALKLGASDYVVKRENYLFHLPALITNAYQRYKLIQNQKALKESEAKYRLIADNSGDVIFTLDLNLNYTYISPAIMALRGYGPEEAIKQKIYDVLTPESYERAVKMLSETMFTDRILLNNPNQQRTIELEMMRKDGTTVWTEVKASLILGEDSNPVGILGVTRDIEKRKFALDELRKLQRAVEQSPESILITNTDGEIEYVNPAIQKISGFSKEELIGQNPRIFSSGKTPRLVYKTLWHKITKGKVWEGEFQNKKKNGEIFWEAVTISPVTDINDKITHYLAIRKDITEQKRMTQELIEAKEQAEESERLKSAFLANMSHEIRTPLNGIMGFADLLQNSRVSTADQELYLGLLKESSERMLNTINELIEMSRLESDLTLVNITIVEINNFVRYFYNFFKPEAEQKGLTLILENPFSDENVGIETDKYKLGSIISNLIRNAIKFTKSGHIMFGCSLDNNLMTFYVSDTGIGIPAGRLNSVFQRFVQADISNSRQYEGLGLGLSISKSYAGQLGGSISVESEPGVGSTFRLIVPATIVKLPESQTANRLLQKPVITNGSHLLFVDDDAINISFFTEVLKTTGYKFLVARNGQEAFDTCMEHPEIALVFMDLKLPVMNGYEATRQIKKIRPDLPVVAQTAHAFDQDMEKALDAGCTDYLTKPYKKEELLNKISQYLGK